MRFIMHFIILLSIVVRTAHGQGHYGKLNINKAPNPWRYFSPPEQRLMPGWYRSNKDFLNNKDKKFYSLEEGIENGNIMPTMGTGYPTSDGIDDGMFQDPMMENSNSMMDNPTYPTAQQNTYPTAAAIPQATYGETGAMQPYPDTGGVYPTQGTYQTGSMIDQFERETAAQDIGMISPALPENYQNQNQYQYQTQSPSQQAQIQFQSPSQQQTQSQTQTQFQPQTEIQQQQQQQQQQQRQNQYQPRPLLQTQSPAPLPRPVLAGQQPRPLVSVNTVHPNSTHVKAKFISKKSFRICAPGPPLKPNPNYKNCLVVGDSIAIGYLRTVKMLLRDLCQVQHAPFARGSGAVDSRHGVRCLANILKTTSMETTHYDAIIFNFGMHDINYSKRFPEEHVSLKNYKKNLRILKRAFLATGAKVAFALTTPHVSSKDRDDRIKTYNEGAVRVMESGHRIPVINLYDVITNRCGSPAENKNCPIMKGQGDVHYNEEGCRLLGVRVAATFQTMLNQVKKKKHDASRPRPRFIGQQYFDRYLSTNAITCPDAITRCPIGSSCCESFLSLTGYGCCMMENAISCQDNWHCCPKGSVCAPTCNVRECHCLSFVQANNGTSINKILKAKVSHHSKNLKKKMKHAKRPLARVLSKWHHKKTISKSLHSKNTSNSHGSVNNTVAHIAHLDNHTVELVNLIEGHHKSRYSDLKDFLTSDDLNSGGSTPKESSTDEEVYDESGNASGESASSEDDDDFNGHSDQHHHNKHTNTESSVHVNEATKYKSNSLHDKKITLHDFSGRSDAVFNSLSSKTSVGSGADRPGGLRHDDIQGAQKSYSLKVPVNKQNTTVKKIPRVHLHRHENVVKKKRKGKALHTPGHKRNNLNEHLKARKTVATKSSDLSTNGDENTKDDLNTFDVSSVTVNYNNPVEQDDYWDMNRNKQLGSESDDAFNNDISDSDESDRDFDLMASASGKSSTSGFQEIIEDNDAKRTDPMPLNHIYQHQRPTLAAHESWVTGENREGITNIFDQENNVPWIKGSSGKGITKVHGTKPNIQEISGKGEDVDDVTKSYANVDDFLVKGERGTEKYIQEDNLHDSGNKEESGENFSNIKSIIGDSSKFSSHGLGSSFPSSDSSGTSSGSADDLTSEIVQLDHLIGEMPKGEDGSGSTSLRNKSSKKMKPLNRTELGNVEEPKSLQTFDELKLENGTSRLEKNNGNIYTAKQGEVGVDEISGKKISLKGNGNVNTEENVEANRKSGLAGPVESTRKIYTNTFQKEVSVDEIFGESGSSENTQRNYIDNNKVQVSLDEISGESESLESTVNAKQTLSLDDMSGLAGINNPGQEKVIVGKISSLAGSVEKTKNINTNVNKQPEDINKNPRLPGLIKNSRKEISVKSIETIRNLEEPKTVVDDLSSSPEILDNERSSFSKATQNRSSKYKINKHIYVSKDNNESDEIKNKMPKQNETEQNRSIKLSQENVNSTEVAQDENGSKSTSKHSTKQLQFGKKIVDAKHSETAKRNQSISKIQKQNQRIADQLMNITNNTNTQQSRTRNSSKRFSMYRNQNFSNVNKHFVTIDSSISERKVIHRQKQKLSFGKIKEDLLDERDDISHERIDSKEPSPAKEADKTLEEYLSFR